MCVSRFGMLLGATLMFTVAACGSEAAEDPPPSAEPTVETSEPAPSDPPAEPEVDVADDPAHWQLTVDGFGPARIGMTAEEALATGGFLRIPFCDVGALVWTGEYSDTDQPAVVANLDDDGVVWRIINYRPPSTLDSGIGHGSPYADLVDAYGDDLFGTDDSTPTDGRYAVNGDSNFLMFVVRDGVLDPIEGIALIGGNVTPDTIPHASTCKAAWRQ